MRSFDFSVDIILSKTLVALGMSTRNLPGVRGWLGLEADSLIAICEPIV
jgi:hypothetical protein